MNYTSTMQTKTNERPLPKGWHWARLGDVCDVVNGYGFPEHLQGRIDLPYPLIKVSDMNREGAEIFVTTASHTIDETILKTIGGKVYPPGTVIFPKVGGALLTNKKRILGVQATFDNNVMGVVPKNVLSEWLYYWLLTIDLKTLSNIQALPSIKQSVVADLQIPLPPLDEQRRIASRLNEQLAAVESARKAAEEQLYAANALRAGYIRQFVEDQVFQKWPSVKLGELLIETRNGLYKLEKFYGRGKRILKMYNIGRLDGTWNLKRVDLIDLTDKEYDDYRLVIGDILLNRVNSRELVGKSAVINEKTEGAVFESKNIRVRVDNTRVLPDFVATYMNSKYGRVQFERRLKQIVGQATINRSDLDSFEIPLPPYDIQQIIISELKSKQIEIDNLEAALESQLAEINRLPASLLREAFAGQG